MNAFSLDSLPPQLLQSIIQQLAHWGVITDISRDYDPRLTKGLIQVPGTDRYQYEPDQFTIPKMNYPSGTAPTGNVFSAPVQLPTQPPTADMMEQYGRKTPQR